MMTVSAKDLHKLDAVLDEIQNIHEPVYIIGEKHSAVLLSESDWRSISETLYLSSIPGMKDSIVSGMQETVESCASSVDW